MEKFKQYYQQVRQQIIQAIPERPGLQVVNKYARAMDKLLRDVFQSTLKTKNFSPQLASQLALLAQGGYGRRELNLYSDIDLVFLCAEQVDAQIEEFIKTILYFLWDLNLEVGYFVRTVPETDQLLGKDMASTTAMIEARIIAGNQVLFDAVREIVKQRLCGDLREWYVRQRLADIEHRKEKWGSSVYLLEPNIKEGLGGLRDIHSMLWLGYVFLGELNLEEFVKRQLLKPAELKQIIRALNFLHKLRNALHLINQRKDDLLTFEKQNRVAALLNYQSREHQLAEEDLMQDYYRNARFVETLTSTVIEKLLQLYMPALSRFPRTGPQQRLGKHFIRNNGWLSIAPEAKKEVLSNALELFALFQLCASEKLRLDNDTIAEINAALPHIDKRFRRHPEARDAFLAILASSLGTANALREMHRSGFLETFIPEFKRVRCLVRLDFYHKYTVDEHLLRAIEVSTELRQHSQSLSEKHPAELVALAQKINNNDWALLNFALLLHDIGKGTGRGHVLLGAQIARRILNRLNLLPAQQEVIHFLVSHHQLLSHIALRRNLDETQVIESAAKEIGDQHLLDLLYLLTYCDIKAVAPDAWNEWKAQLLFELYQKITHYLAGEQLPPPQFVTPPQELVDTLMNNIRQRTGSTPHNKQRLINFVNNLPSRYLTTIDPVHMAEHFLLMTRLSDTNPVEIAVHLTPGNKLTEICFVTTDRPGLFRDLCLILSSSGINIYGAQIFTTADGFCFDVFQVTDYYGRALPDGFRYDLLKKDFVDLTSQRKPIEFFLKRQRRARAVSPERFKYIPTKVTLNNELSPTYSVLEVKTVDRPWVLYTITSILREEEININLAFITTEAYRVVDVFYITDLDNNKIDDEQDINRIIQRLTEALQHPDLQTFLLSSKSGEIK